MQALSPDLSAQEVNLLHQIILRAQNHADFLHHPNRTLFDAYEAVFAENALDTNQDRACLRLLLQLGGPGIPGVSLYDKFEKLLEQAGIALRFEEDDGSVSVAIREDEPFSPESTDPSPFPRHLERRNSFTSVYDVTSDVRRFPRSRRPSFDGVTLSPHKAVPAIHLSRADDLVGGRHNTTEGPARNQFPIHKGTEEPLKTSLRNRIAEMANTSQPTETQPTLDEESTELHRAHMMGVAIQKDRLALLRQAFSNWKNGVRVSFQQRRLAEIEIALQVQREHIFQRANETYQCSLVAKAFCHWMFLAKIKVRETEEARKWLMRHKCFTRWHRLTIYEETQVQRPTKTRFLRKWLRTHRQQQADLSECEQRVSRMQDWRVARLAFSSWSKRAQAIKLAEQRRNHQLISSHMRFLQLNVRAKREREQKDHKMKAKYLYWMIVEVRAQQFIRQHQSQTNQRCLKSLIDRFRARRDILAIHEAQVLQQRNNRVLISTLECWKLQVNVQRERSQMAVEFYHPKIELDSLSIWRARVQEVRRQELRAEDAAFYFLTTRVLKGWSAKAKELRKARLNEAYKHARRSVKVNLLQRAFSTWKARTDRVFTMQQQSIHRQDQRSRGMVQRAFVKWQIAGSRVHQSLETAVAHSETTLTKRTVQTMLDRAREVQALRTRADQFYSIRLSDMCLGHLRKLSMKAFEIKRRQQDADAVRSRHITKHLRIMLRHWASSTKDLTLVFPTQKPSPMSATAYYPPRTGTGTGTTPTVVGSFAETSTHATTGTAAHTTSTSTVQEPPTSTDPNTIPNPKISPATLLSTTHRAEEWSAFDQDLLEPNPNITTSMTPGYLNTPSKRAARVRALVNASTTPAGTPWSANLRRFGTGAATAQGKKGRGYEFRDIG